MAFWEGVSLVGRLASPEVQVGCISPGRESCTEVEGSSICHRLAAGIRATGSAMRHPGLCHW